ncbi:hypothetical protein F5B20DRAFT_571882 [Whalleya microplaca]|nr:hypothetical protein F5B20DRAFT_571882 [Whalleya microplaca]
MQSQLVTSIVAEVQGVTLTPEPTSEANDKLNGNIESIRLLCERISEKMSTYEEATQWQKRSHEADMVAQSYMDQIQQYQNSLHQAQMCIDEQTEERQQLQSQLATFQTAAEANETATGKINDLTTQIAQLNQGLNEKSQAILRSDESLKAAREDLRNQTRQLQEIEEQARNDRQTHKQTLEENLQQHEQAIFQAVNEKAARLKEQYQGTEQHLQETEKARAQLEQEVAKLRCEAEEVGRLNIDHNQRQIREELSTTMSSVAKLRADLKASEEAREALVGRLEEWSHNRAEIHQMQQVLMELARDQPNAIQMNNQFTEMLEIQKKLGNTYEHHHSQLTSLEATANAGHNREGQSIIGFKDISIRKVDHDGLQDRKRKVVVQSPFTEDEGILPVSVEQERSTRRQSVPPRGIMKMITRSASRESEAQECESNEAPATANPPQPHKRRTASRGSAKPLTVHSAYNRPVVGSISAMSYKASVSQESFSAHKHGTGEVTEVDNERLTKRQRVSSVGQGRGQGKRSGQSSKPTRSMSEYFEAPLVKNEDVLCDEIPPESQTSSLQGGPLPRKSSGLITYGPKGSDASQTSYRSGKIKEESQDDPDKPSIRL